MAATNATYSDGESRLPQTRPASAVSPAYVDGESGKLPILNYVAAGGGTSILRQMMAHHGV
jgi:hypothetical protein